MKCTNCFHDKGPPIQTLRATNTQLDKHAFWGTTSENSDFIQNYKTLYSKPANYYILYYNERKSWKTCLYTSMADD